MSWLMQNVYSLKENLMSKLFPRTYPYKAYLRRINRWTDASDLRKFIAANENRDCSLTRSEKQNIFDVWRPWFKGEMLFEGFRMQKSIIGALDPHFVPTYLYLGYILPGLSGYMEDVVLSDKGLYGFLYKDVSRPYEIVRNINGVWYDNDNKLINEMEAAKKVLSHVGDLIIKKSINSCGGLGVKVIHPTSRDAIADIFKEFSSDFVVQEKITQHSSMARFNESSLNTFRVTTLFLNGKVSKLLCNLRYGSPGSAVDNLASGGGMLGVHDDGTITVGVNSKGCVDSSLSDGTKFSEIRIPYVTEIVDFAKSLHERVPYCPIIGWDIAMGENGTPILIELNTVNTSVLIEQIPLGSLFGETNRFDEVMDYVTNHGPRKHNGGCMNLRFDSYKPAYYL